MLCSTLRQTDRQTPPQKPDGCPTPAQLSPRKIATLNTLSLQRGFLPQRSGESTGTSTNFCRSRRSLANHSARCTGTSYMTTPSSNASLLLSLCFSASAEAGASHYQFVPQESFTLLDRPRKRSKKNKYGDDGNALYASSAASSAASVSLSSSQSPPNRHVRRRKKKKGVFLVQALD